MGGGIFSGNCHDRSFVERLSFANHQWPATSAKSGTDGEELILFLKQKPSVEGKLGNVEALLKGHPVEGFNIVQMYANVVFLRQLEKDKGIVRAGGISAA